LTSSAIWHPESSKTNLIGRPSVVVSVRLTSSAI